MSKLLRIFLIIAILAALATGYYYFKEEKAATELTLYGNVDIREVDLGFRVFGKLIEMRFEEGDSVKKGDKLALLDAEPYQREYEAAAARVRRAEAMVQKFESGNRPQEIKSAQAQVAEAEAAFNNARRNYLRQTELIEAKAASQKVWEQAEARHDENAARLKAARESLALLEEGFRKEDIAASREELKEARVQLDLARIRVLDSTLIAPSDGLLISRILEPGTILSPGTPVYTVSLHNPIYIRAYIAGPDLGKISTGTPVEITSDSSSITYPGKIGFISPRAEFTPKNVETPELRTDLVYRLRIVAEDLDNGLRQGMPVTIRIAEDTTREKDGGHRH